MSGYAASDFKMSAHPSAGLCPLWVLFDPFCSCTPSFNFHPLIYLCLAVPELIPSAHPATLCLDSCPCPILLFPSSALPQPFQFTVLSFLISQSPLLLIFLSKFGSVPQIPNISTEPTFRAKMGIISKMTSNYLKSCYGIWQICVFVQATFTALLVLPNA